MKLLEVLVKLFEVITPAFSRSLNQKRNERLEIFFDKVEKISASEKSEAAKKVLLNSEASALTGAKYAEYEELSFFLLNFSPNSFEDDYWAFARNRSTFEVKKNDEKICAIESVRSKTIQMVLLNLLILLFTLFAPIYFYVINSESFYLDISILGTQVQIVQIMFWVIIIICVLAAVKVIYDWSCWSDVRVLIKKKFKK